MSAAAPKLRLGLRNTEGPDVTVVLNGEPVSTLYGREGGLSGIIPHPSAVCAPDDPHAALYERLGAQVRIKTPDDTPTP